MSDLSSEQTGNLGVKLVGFLFARWGWYVRELPPPDDGVDALIELPQAQGQAKGRLIGLQSKAGTSYFRWTRKNGWVVEIKNARLAAYWLTYSVPVIVVIYNPDTDTAYWRSVKLENLEQTKSGEWVVWIPDDAVLNEAALAQLEEIANQGLASALESADNAEDALKQLRSDLELELIEIVASSDANAFLETTTVASDESKRSALRLVLSSRYGADECVREWSATTLQKPFPVDLAASFPWATVSIDRPFYEGYDRAVWLLSPESDEDHEDSWLAFEDWRDGLPDVRPYGASVDGEQQLWRLRVELNDVGHTTLDRARDAMLEEIYLADAVEEGMRPRRLSGEYLGRSVGPDMPPGRLWEQLVFVPDDEDALPDVLLDDWTLWDTEDKRRLVASSIVEDATREPTTREVADAFVKQFADRFDTDEWVINLRDVRVFLEEELGLQSGRK